MIIARTLRDSSLEDLFFLTSGEHPTLPKAEILSLLESTNAGFEIRFEDDQIFGITMPRASAKTVAVRAAFVKSLNKAITITMPNEGSIIETVSTIPLDSVISPSDSFFVRIRRIRGKSRQVSTLKLEEKIGEIIYNRVKDSKVDFKNPKKKLRGFLTSRGFYLGLEIAAKPAGWFKPRMAGKKPFFQPSSLQPKLARCIVNLTSPQDEDLILDPFCGTGTTLIEAALMGFETVGCDVLRKMINGSRVNLNYYGSRRFHLLLASALHFPFRQVQRIATDPPYGHSTTTKGLETREIVSRFLMEASKAMPAGGRVCFAAPDDITVTDFLDPKHWQIKDVHKVYVHRSLTRQIFVLERM